MYIIYLYKILVYTVHFINLQNSHHLQCAIVITFMEVVRLGLSDLVVSRICLGTMLFGEGCR